MFQKYTGILDRMDFENIRIYLGRGVGGGSLVNGGMAVSPRREYFEEIFPNLDSTLFFNKYFPLAHSELDTTIIPEEYYNSSSYYKFSRKGEEQAKKAGYKTLKIPSSYDFNYIQMEEKNEVPKSALDNEVIYGNNHGKKDLTKNYLKKALETGNVTILALHKAEQIIQLSNGQYKIKVNKINTRGTTIETFHFLTNKLFLGAGSIGTTELLLKSVAMNTLNCNNNFLGKLWGNNGNVMTGRNFVKGGTGASQSTIPVAAIDGWTNNDDAILAEIAPLPIGMETWTSLFLVINKLKKYGEILYDNKRKVLALKWGKTHTNHMVKNVKQFISKMNNTNGGTIASLLFDKGIGEYICYHPLGGCVLGKVTDKYGRLNGAPGIYITDGSLIPGTVGVNPYITITAIAEYCIEHVIKCDFLNKQNTLEKKEPKIDIYPVPFQNHLTIRWFSEVCNKYKIQLFDSFGNKKLDVNITLEKGNDYFKLTNLNNLKTDIYVLKIYNKENQEVTRRILKKE